MSIVTGIAIYLTIWWTALFALLPLGGKTYWREGQEPPVKGMDSGAPIEPRLKQKFLLTTTKAGPACRNPEKYRPHGPFSKTAKDVGAIHFGFSTTDALH